MRVGILADTHLSRVRRDDPAVSWAIEQFADIDAILHAGDVGDLDWLETVAFAGIPIYAVAGNCDELLGDPRLPGQRIVTFDRWRIGLTHGWGGPNGMVDRVATLFARDEVQAVVFGHSHQPHLEKRQGVVYFNPGSLTQPRGGPPSLGLLTEQDGVLTFTHVSR